MKIDIQTIKILSKDKKKRIEEGKKNQDIKSNMYPFSKEFLSYLESLSTFEIASIMLDKNNWISSRTTSPSKTWVYKPGDIIMIYLGSSNYGYEPSYFHPAIVFANFYDSVLVIPCSSTIPTHPRIIIGDTCHGFKNKTAILIDKLRVVDKKRIQRNASGGIVGNLDKDKLKDVRDMIISIYLPGTERFIDKLKNDNEILIKEKEKLLKENKLLKEEIEKLTKKLKIKRKRKRILNNITK